MTKFLPSILGNLKEKKRKEKKRKEKKRKKKEKRKKKVGQT